MFMCINNGVSKCCEVKLIAKLKKTIKFGKIKQFLKKKCLPIGWGLGEIGLEEGLISTYH